MKLKEYIQCIPHILRHKSFLNQLTSNPTKDQGTIISLTSIPSRFNTLHLVIASLLNQNTSPCPIHLWIDHDAVKELPPNLTRLKGLGLHIHPCEDVGVHTKLVHAITNYPKHNVITVDDDLLYPNFWLQALLKDSDKHQNCVSGFTCRQLQLKSSNSLAPYKTLPRVSSSINEPSHTLMALGYAGVLYPPNVLHSETSNPELFQKYCPHADDIWFKAMALRNNSPHRKIPFNFGKEIYLPFTQKISLKKVNVRGGANDKQLQAVFDHYKLYDMIDTTP